MGKKHIGHAPNAREACSSANPLLHALMWPGRAYVYLIYTCRPNIITSKTRDKEWAQLQSQWRWAQAVVAYIGPPSHVLWHIKWPLMANMIVMAFAILDAYLPGLNIMVKDGVTAAVTLSWRMSSFMLAMLLTFRVNRSYDRWWTARQAFAGVGNAALSLATMATLWVHDPALQAEIVRWCKVWHFSIYQLLTRQPLHPTAAALLSPEELAYYSKSRKGRNLVTTRLRQLVDKAPDLTLTQSLQMDQAINKGITDQGMCARIMFQAMPYALTLFCTGFLEVWLLIAPFGLIPDANKAMPGYMRMPAFELLLYLLICILMLGVDEIANQLEQPFPYMPLLDIVETTTRDIDRLQEEADTLECLGRERLVRGAVMQQQQQQKQKHSPDSPQDCMVVMVPLPAAAASDGRALPPAQHCQK